MRLGFRRSAPAPSPPAGIVSLDRIEQSSRALPQIIGRLKSAPRCGVLDLGGPVRENVELYARHGARITYADYFRFRNPRDPQRGSAIPSSPGRFDVVLAWDLFNFLTLDEIAGIMDAIVPRSAPGAILLALITMDGQMAPAPSSFAVVDDHTLTVVGDHTLTVVNDPAAPDVRSPAYSEQSLLRAMPRSTVESRFQLRNGMVEYLFAYR